MSGVPGEPWWRSLLFVPAHVPRFVAKAATLDADAVVLDLEDGVPAARKADARAAVSGAAATIAAAGVDVLVRINPGRTEGGADLAAAVCTAVAAVVVPKTDGAQQPAAVAAELDRLEHERGIGAGTIGIVAQVESVHALAALDAIARAPRVVAINLGTEDFCASAGMACDEELLLQPCQQVVFAARRAGIEPLGFAGPIAGFDDPDAFRAMVRRARRLGFGGGFAIHPSQLAVLNEEFTPSAAQLAQARRIVAAFDAAKAEGAGAVALGGRMVDAPVAERARQVLDRARRIGRRRPRAGD